MNQNDIIEFQQNFTAYRLKSVKDIELENPFLKSEFSYALSTASLTNKYIMIYSNNGFANNYVDKLVLELSKKYRELYFFIVDLKELVETNKIESLEKFKNILPYANILFIKNFETVEKNSQLLILIQNIFNNLKNNSFVLITSSKRIDQIQKADNLKRFLENLKIYDILVEKKEKNNFINFFDFVNQVKKEAGIEEKLDEEEKRSEYIEKLYVWEMKGFNVDNLKKIINLKDLNQIKTEFDKYTFNIKKLMELHKEYGLLNTKRFKEEAREIEKLLFDPYAVDELNKKIETLKEKINYFNFFEKETSLLYNSNNFIVDSTNRNVMNKIEEIINGSNIDKIVLITGGPGTGKTHLLNLIFNQMLDKKVVYLNKNNFESGKKNLYVMKFINEADIILIDDLDKIFEKKENIPLIKNIIFNNIVKVITLQRKFSIDDKDLLDIFKKFLSYNIQPTSLFIKKNVFKSFLIKYGIKMDDILFNFLLDYDNTSLSESEKYFMELKKYENNITREVIKYIFPSGVKKRQDFIKKGEFDTSRLLKEWLNDTDRLYVEFEG